MNAGDDPGSAISFGTDGWRAAGEAFTLDRVRLIAQAVATYLDDTAAEGPVAVGYDARETSREAAEQLARVVAANGRNVTIATIDCPTPVLAWTVADGPYVGGLMVTASHNPPEYNGVKFVTDEGAPALPEVTDALADRLAPPTAVDSTGSISEEPLAERYIEHALSFVETHLDGLTIAYDGMYGSGRIVTPTLLERAGGTVSRHRCETDPTFGGVPPEPAPENATAVREQLKSGDAELGFINDGDADRLGVLTPARGYLDPNILLCVIYEYLLERDSGDVVRSVSTSSLVDRIARAHDRSVHETAVGFKWVASEMAAHNTLVGGEESGGYGITAHLRNKDGVLLALLLAAAHTERSIDDRIDAILDEHGSISQGRESINCPDSRKATVLTELESVLPDKFAGVSVENIQTVDGFKFSLTDGSWVLVRPSGTEPKMRIYAEAGDGERVETLLAAGVELVEPLVDG